MPHTATILGRRFRIRWVPRMYADGECDGPEVRGKEIRLAKRLQTRPLDLMETVIHEALHGAGWHLDEAMVTAYARDTARLLRRLGFIHRTEAE